jgi:hypothetical protein
LFSWEMRGMNMHGLVGFKNDTCFEEKHNCARGWAYTTIKHMCLMSLLSKTGQTCSAAC